MEISDNTQLELATSKQKGDSLESAIEYIFNIAGFNTERNVFIAKYEVDVKATIGDRTVIIECKNYQNSSLSIRNLIHQWHSKNEIIKAHKIVIAVAGVNIQDSDLKLAKELDIEVWNQLDITDLFNLSLNPDELRKVLLHKISFSPITIAERYRDNITYLVIKPHLSGKGTAKESLYGLFNKWLRAFILTELQMTETTPEERAKLIELFEGTKRTKYFFNLLTKTRTQQEYWEAVKHELKTNSLLPPKRQHLYLVYMDDLVKEFNFQRNFYREDDNLIKSRKLIANRMRYALIHDESCAFTTESIPNVVQVTFKHEEKIEIIISDITREESNILNWIMTSQSTLDSTGKENRHSFLWKSSHLDDAIEKVYRFFTEFHDISDGDRIVDKEL